MGCGTGKLSKVFADLVGPEGQVVAIDPDTERLKIAREKHDADYDLIFSNFVFHHLKNKEPVFQQAQKMLKRGGLLAFCGALKALIAMLPTMVLKLTTFAKSWLSLTWALSTVLLSFI